jgi:hypothetical protein
MEIPNIPTDNYYKFLSLSGVLIMVASIFFCFTQYNSISTEIENIDLELTKLELEKKFLTEDSKKVEMQIDDLQKHADKLNGKDPDEEVRTFFKFNQTSIQNDKNFRDYLEFLFKYKEEMIPEIIKAEKIKIEFEKQKKLDRELQIKTLSIKFKTKLLGNKINTWLFISLTCALFFISGLIISKRGFKNWYLLVQKLSDEKLKLEVDELKKKIK